MNAKANWFRRWLSKDRRRSERRLWPNLIAHYWTGAAPLAIGIRDISYHGLYLLTQERWYPGTIITIVLQRKDRGNTAAQQSISVQSKVIRRAVDGVGLEFVLAKVEGSGVETPNQVKATDRKTLAEFLDSVVDSNTEVSIDGA